ncbi:MAG: hypothetical protein JKY14_07430 [Paraglaciecola sp.]|nr:hypothetical protein [Paraglaciecola sp.]
MLDSVNTSQPDTDVSAQALLSSDYELNGTINRATNEGAKFALLLAMLEQDCTHRPQIEKTEELSPVSEGESKLHHYRSPPLSVNNTYWQTSQHTSQLIYSGQLHSAQLWLAMHPEPLSQHNKANAIDEDVIANCSLNTQRRLQASEEKVVKLDETVLYDILQELEPISA